MLLEQHIEEFFPSAEIRIPEARERVGHVDHATMGSEIENAERSGDFESLAARNCRAPAVIDENEVGSERQPKRNRRLPTSSNTCNEGSSAAATSDTSSQEGLEL
jgi:hypothetical protein